MRVVGLDPTTSAVAPQRATNCATPAPLLPLENLFAVALQGLLFRRGTTLLWYTMIENMAIENV